MEEGTGYQLALSASEAWIHHNRVRPEDAKASVRFELTTIPRSRRTDSLFNGSGVLDERSEISGTLSGAIRNSIKFQIANSNTQTQLSGNQILYILHYLPIQLFETRFRPCKPKMASSLWYYIPQRPRAEWYNKDKNISDSLYRNSTNSLKSRWEEIIHCWKKVNFK